MDAVFLIIIVIGEIRIFLLVIHQQYCNIG